MMNRLRPVTIFVFCLTAIALIGYPLIRQVSAFALSDESASHIVLIPFVAAVLIFQQRERIFAKLRSDYSVGLPLLIAGAMLLIAVRFGPPADGPAFLTLAAVALVVLSIGAFVIVFGRAPARAGLFPLLFLGFAIPIPSVILDSMVAMLKSGSTEVVAALFTFTGTPFHRDGFIFSLPGVVIEIADECSGIRSSIALLLTSLLAGHAFLQRFWTKSMLVLIIVPITMLKNGVRIVSLSLLAIHVDPSFLTGQLHHEGGIVFFVLALAMLMPVLAIFRRLESSVRQMGPAGHAATIGTRQGASDVQVSPASDV